MKVLLDENFPLPLLDALRADGIDADHIITLGLRGISDAQIGERLNRDPILFLTQDTEFIMAEMPATGWIVVSRVKQSRELDDRVRTWIEAVRRCLATTPANRILELIDDGRLLPWFDSASGRHATSE